MTLGFRPAPAFHRHSTFASRPSPLWRWLAVPCIRLFATLLVLLIGGWSLPPAQGATPEAIQTIRSVGPEGLGNADAAQAWRELVALDASALPTLLTGMNGASGLAVNWLHTAVDAIVERELGAGRKLPVGELGAFLLETTHDPRARRLAFEILARIESATAALLVPGMLNDPAPQLRRDAVTRVMADADARLKAGGKEGAAILFRQALAHARDADQIEALTKSLRELGQTPDVPRLFGFLTAWKVMGPFDNTKNQGFLLEYPPEKTLDFNAEYDGKTGKVRWVDLQTKDDFATVNLNGPLGKVKEVAGYATTEFVAEAARTVELRLASQNAWKLWLNGQLLFARDEYHRGRALDQYRLPATLRAGPNRILVKVCQNDLVEEWTEEWQFQLRITDALGTPVRPVEKGGARP